MTFRFQMLSDSFDAARILRIQLAAGPKGPPIRSNAGSAARALLIGRIGCNPGKNAGSYRATDSDVMLRSENGANFINRDQLASRDLVHDFVDFAWRRHNHGAAAPAFA